MEQEKTKVHPIMETQEARVKRRLEVKLKKS